MRQHRTAHDEDTLDIDPQHRLQRLERHVERRPHPRDPGIVDEEVDLLEARERGGDGIVDLVGGGDIYRQSKTADFGRNGLRRSAVAVEHRHHHAVADEPSRDGAPDPAARPGNQPDTSVQRRRQAHLIWVIQGQPAPIADRRLLERPNPPASGSPVSKGARETAVANSGSYLCP